MDLSLISEKYKVLPSYTEPYNIFIGGLIYNNSYTKSNDKFLLEDYTVQIQIYLEETITNTGRLISLRGDSYDSDIFQFIISIDSNQKARVTFKDTNNETVGSQWLKTLTTYPLVTNKLFTLTLTHEILDPVSLQCEAKLYVNDVLVDNGTFIRPDGNSTSEPTIAMISPNYLTTGADFWSIGLGENGTYYKGLLRNVKMWETILTEQQITDESTGLTVTNDLLVYYPQLTDLNIGSSTIADESGNGYDTVVVGTEIYGVTIHEAGGSNSFIPAYANSKYYFWEVNEGATNVALKELSEIDFNQYIYEEIDLNNYKYAKQYNYVNNVLEIIDVDFNIFPDTEDIVAIKTFSEDSHVFLLIEDSEGKYMYYYDSINKKSGILTITNEIETILDMKVKYYEESYYVSVVYIDENGDLMYSPNNEQSLYYTNNDSFTNSNGKLLEEDTAYDNSYEVYTNQNNIVAFNNYTTVDVFYNEYFIYSSIETNDLFDSNSTTKKSINYSYLNEIPFNSGTTIIDDELIIPNVLSNDIEGVEDGSVENTFVFGYNKINVLDLFDIDSTIQSEVEAITVTHKEPILTQINTNTINNYKIFSKGEYLYILSESELILMNIKNNEFDYKKLDTTGMDLTNGIAFDQQNIDFDVLNNYVRFNNNFSKYEYLEEENFNSDIVFVNMLRFLPEWFKEKQSLVAIVDVFEKVYNDGMRIADRNYDFLDVALNYKSLFTNDDRLYYLFKENPDIFFYNKYNTNFGGQLFEQFEKLKEQNQIKTVDESRLMYFLADLGLDWIYDTDFYDDAKKGYQITDEGVKPTLVNTNKIDSYEFVVNQSSDSETYKNNLTMFTDLSNKELRDIFEIIVSNRWLIHSKSFYTIMIYLLGFMYDVKFLHLGVNTHNLVNINTYEMGNKFSDNFNNKIYLNVDMKELNKNTNSLMNSINYIVKIINKTLPINMCFSGVVFNFDKTTFNISNTFKATNVRVITN